jgi:hypothetical protein
MVVGNGLNRDVAPTAIGGYWCFFTIEMSALQAFYIKGDRFDVRFEIKKFKHLVSRVENPQLPSLCFIVF